MKATFSFIISSLCHLLNDEFYLFPLVLFSVVFLIYFVKEIAS